MKMIRAIIRPEKVEDVANALDTQGFPALTKIDVFGRGKQGGIHIGSITYSELPKTMLLLVVDDKDIEQVVEIIFHSARTGNIGDGKIFVTDVIETYTIRTGERTA